MSPFSPPRTRDPSDSASDSSDDSGVTAPLDLARFFSYSRDVLAILDQQGRILMVSPSVKRWLRYEVDDLADVALLDLVHSGDLEEVQARVREVSEVGAAADIDGRFRRADGGWLPMRWSLSRDGPKGLIYGVGRDRSGDLRRYEEARSREAADLRLRTAGELHDGVLQTLTAAGLQIAVAHRLMRADPAAAADVLRRLGEGLAAEQREIRLYVDEMNLEEPLWADVRIPLGDRVANMLDRISTIWGVGTSLDSELRDSFQAEFDRQVMRVVQEGVVNAARHGGATNVRVRLAETEDALDIALDDDGHGFPFVGVFTDRDLRDKRLGPVSLKRRVAQSGGTISIDSSPTGAKVRITVPVERGS